MTFSKQSKGFLKGRDNNILLGSVIGMDVSRKQKSQAADYL